MNYVNKALLSATLLLSLAKTDLSAMSFNWKQNFLGLSKPYKAVQETVNENKPLYGGLAFFGIGGLIYGTNSKVRSALNNGVSKAKSFFQAKAKSLYNKTTGITPKTATLGVVAAGTLAAATAGTALGINYINKNNISPYNKVQDKYVAAKKLAIENPKTSIALAIGTTGILGAIAVKLYNNYNKSKNQEVPLVINHPQKSTDVKKQLFEDLKEALNTDKSPKLTTALESGILEVAQDDYSILLSEDFFNLLTPSQKTIINILNDKDPEPTDKIISNRLYNNFLHKIGSEKLSYLCKKQLLGIEKSWEIIIDHEEFYNSLSKDQKNLLSDIIQIATMEKQIIQ